MCPWFFVLNICTFLFGVEKDKRKRFCCERDGEAGRFLALGRPIFQGVSPRKKVGRNSNEKRWKRRKNEFFEGRKGEELALFWWRKGGRFALLWWRKGERFALLWWRKNGGLAYTLSERKSKTFIFFGGGKYIGAWLLWWRKVYIETCWRIRVESESLSLFW